ncbi:MAG: hypothetical protein COB03_18635 [Alteromonas sp.]|nr:MAG: hypothetical protein COB03_18635 [Alteromonas sp.]
MMNIKNPVKQTSIADASSCISTKRCDVEEQKQLKAGLVKRTNSTSLAHKKLLAKAFQSLAKEMDQTRNAD